MNSNQILVSLPDLQRRFEAALDGRDPRSLGRAEAMVHTSGDDPNVTDLQPSPAPEEPRQGTA